MQKIVYLCTSQNESLTMKELEDINNSMGKNGKVISITPARVAGRNNTIDWLIVIETQEEINL